VCWRRFIPAYAGNSPPMPGPRRARPVHPRVRGELRKRGPLGGGVAGSSPRTRGTLCRACRLGADGRFIPAYAGNSLARARRSRRQTVHPRVRGELAAVPFGVLLPDGSSPRTRGTRERARWPRCPNRFIPAYAGNSTRCLAPSPAMAVHPRVRGELSIRTSYWRSNPGSSPRTRGTPRLDQRERERLRFIPAYAGNSRSVMK